MWKNGQEAHSGITLYSAENRSSEVHWIFKKRLLFRGLCLLYVRALRHSSSVRCSAVHTADFHIARASGFAAGYPASIAFLLLVLEPVKQLGIVQSHHLAAIYNRLDQKHLCEPLAVRRSDLMPLLNQTIIGSAFTLMSFTHPVPDQPKDNLAPVFRTDQIPTTYVCGGAFPLQVTWMSVNTNQLISVSHPSGRTPQRTRTLLLPLSQSGSGERYATDLASFHIKGDQAVFTSAETALSDNFRFPNCRKVR